MFINTGLKKKKNIPKAVTIIKEDRQAFGLLLSKEMDLSEAFQYPITSVSLSIATPDSQLRSGPKYLFGNLLINESKAETNISPENAIWIYDGMALMRTL